MADDRYIHTTDGQELQQADINQVATTAALSEDHVYRELLRLFPNGDGRSPDRGVLPWEGTRPGGTYGARNPLVKTANPTTKTVTVAPFRLLLGSRQAAFTDKDGARDAMEDNRSGLALGATTVEQDVSLGADTSANDRWTLVYAAINVDLSAPNVNRFVKDPATGVVSSVAISVNRDCPVTLATVLGAEGATPTRPSLPADAGTQYNVPLAYVYCAHPFTSSSVVDPNDIQTVAPCLAASPGVGAVSCEPASGMWESSGPVATNHTWDGTARPEPYLPSSMTGAVERIIQLKWESTDRTIPLSGFATLDDSIDWRDRLFQSIIVVGDATTRDFASARLGGTAVVPSNLQKTLGTNMSIQMGQSFVADGGAPVARVAYLSPTELSDMGSGSVVQIYVDTTTGYLRGTVNASDPDVKLFMWLRATGGFHE
jgi:hypothetical protein